MNINTIPCLTWNWMKINQDKVELSVPFAETKLVLKNKADNLTISDKAIDVSGFAQIGSGCANFANPKLNAEDHAPNPVNIKDVEPVVIHKLEEHPLNQIIDSVVSKPQNITISGKSSEPVVFTIENSGKENQAAAQNIIAEKDSEATLILLYKNEEPSTAEITQIIRTRIYVEENATLHIVKVQLFDKNVNQIDDTAFVGKDNSKLQFTQIELGANHITSGLHTTLSGYQSKFESNVAYLCKDNQYLDMNHIVYQFGQKSECNMKVNGSLKDNSTKVYRGIIDLKKGCSGAKGHEMEETLLLNPKVVNKSLPVILCDEEDVEGVHGCTIGRLSGDILFYMQTRGISQSEAEKIMSMAKVQAVADLITDEAVKSEIETYLEKNFLQD